MAAAESLLAMTFTWKLQEDALSDADLDALVALIRSKERFTQGPRVLEFERQYAKWIGCPYCVMVNSGSSANLLLVNAAKNLCGWKAEDEILVPAVTWPTTVTPVIQCGLKPVFVDVNLTDLSFDYEKLEKSITGRTRGIFVAHLIGLPANMQLIMRMAKNFGITVLEDCCEAQGAECSGQTVGSFGLGGTFSFYWGHHMTTIEGGMITTNNEELFHLLRLKRSHGLARELPPHVYHRVALTNPDIDPTFLFLTDGMNFRSTELNAVLGISQLARLNRFIRIRNNNFWKFDRMCWPFDDLLPVWKPGASSFALPFIFHDRNRMLSFRKVLRDNGIESRPLVSGNLLRQPFLQDYYVTGWFPNADFLHEHAFYIGNHQFVTESRLEKLGGLMRKHLR